MTEQQMRDIIDRFTEKAWNGADLDVVDELFSEGYVGHDTPNAEPVRGPEGMKNFLRMYHAAFSDARIVLDDVLVAGDHVVTRWTGTGTHDGDLMGIPPTGSAVRFTGIRIFRLDDGKIVEGWVNWDMYGLMKQLGQP